MDCIVYGVTKGRTQLSNFHFHGRKPLKINLHPKVLRPFDNFSKTQVFPGNSDGKESACNAGDLGLIPGFGKIWRRKRLPTPVFLPGEFHGLYSPWGCKESDTTE